MALKRGLTGEIKQTSSSESVMTVMAPIVIVFLVAKWGTDGWKALPMGNELDRRGAYVRKI